MVFIIVAGSFLENAKQQITDGKVLSKVPRDSGEV